MRFLRGLGPLAIVSDRVSPYQPSFLLPPGVILLLETRRPLLDVAPSLPIRCPLAFSSPVRRSSRTRYQPFSVFSAARDLNSEGVVLSGPRTRLAWCSCALFHDIQRAYTLLPTRTGARHGSRHKASRGSSIVTPSPLVVNLTVSSGFLLCFILPLVTTPSSPSTGCVCMHRLGLV